jgi:hypothetical protein
MVWPESPTAAVPPKPESLNPLPAKAMLGHSGERGITEAQDPQDPKVLVPPLCPLASQQFSLDSGSACLLAQP